MPASGYRSQEVVLDKKQIEIKLEGKGEEQQHCCPDNKWCPIKMPHQRIVLANIGLVLFSFYFFYHFTSSYLNSTISPIEYDFPREHSFENPSNPGRSLSSSSSTMTAIQNIVQKFQVFGKEDGTEDAASSAGGDNGNNPGSAATSGKLFQGNKIREYPPRDRLFRDSPLEPVEADNSRCQLKCANWAVATTIFEPSEAVRRLRYTDLCVVVVGDKTKPESYKIPSSSLGENVIFLDAEDQMGIGSGFVAGLPWKHFGRKNVGYLFAIGCGAKSIWDFDDDNIFKFWLEGASPDEKLDYRTYVTKGAEGTRG